MEKFLILFAICTPQKYLSSETNDVAGELCTCGIGVRQGENVSCLLFALFIYLFIFIMPP